MSYTVKELAALAGVTVRTLHHAGVVVITIAIRADVARLQSILFYRELDLPLERIKPLLDRAHLGRAAVLREQRAALVQRLGRLHRLIATIDETLFSLEGSTAMKPKQLFAGLDPEEEQQLTDEAARRWDAQTVHTSHQRWKRYSAARKQAILDEGNAIYRDLIAAMPLGPEAAPVQACIKRWRKHVGYFWSPNDEQCLGLAQLYRDDPAFRANFDAMHPNLATFMVAAVEVHVRRSA